MQVCPGCFVQRQAPSGSGVSCKQAADLYLYIPFSYLSLQGPSFLPLLAGLPGASLSPASAVCFPLIHILITLTLANL